MVAGGKKQEGNYSRFQITFHCNVPNFVVFGLVQSPFLLAGTLKQHLNSLRERYPAGVGEIEKCLYVDNIISGGCTTDEILSRKETTVSMFEAAKFQLHKRHSNESKLESSKEDSDL